MKFLIWFHLQEDIFESVCNRDQTLDSLPKSEQKLAFYCTFYNISFCHVLKLFHTVHPNLLYYQRSSSSRYSLVLLSEDFQKSSDISCSKASITANTFPVISLNYNSKEIEFMTRRRTTWIFFPLTWRAIEST